MTSVSNSNGSILVILIPLSDGVQLVSYQFENSSYVVRETWFVQQPIQNCHAVFFSRSNPVHPVFFSYCISLPTHTLRYSMLTVLTQQLNLSQISLALESFNIGTDAALSNFLSFENRDAMCFFNDRAHTVFLRNNDLVDHNVEDGVYFADNNIFISSCLMSEPRIQMFERECMMAAYCNDTSVLFGTPERFFPNQVFAFTEETDGQVFFCNSTVYVNLHNNTLSVKRRNGDTLSNFLAFGYQRVILGDCLVSSSEQFFFVALLSDSSVVLVDFNNLISHVLADSENESPNLGSLQYAVQSDLLIVSNGSWTAVYNWSRVAVCTRCTDDVITIDGTFDLVATMTRESGFVTDPTTMTTVTMSTAIIVPGTEPSTTSGVSATSTSATDLITNKMTAGGLPVVERVEIGVAVTGVALIAGFIFILVGVIVRLCIRR